MDSIGGAEQKQESRDQQQQMRAGGEEEEDEQPVGEEGDDEHEQQEEQEGRRPLFLLTLFDQEAQIGDNLLLLCRVTGDPAPTVEFQTVHDSTQIQTGTRMLVQQNTDNTTWALVIADVQESDFCKYRAFARNSKGEAVSECTVYASEEGSDEPTRRSKRSVKIQVSGCMDAIPGFHNDEIVLIARHEACHGFIIFFSWFFFPEFMNIDILRQGFTKYEILVVSRTKEVCLKEIECYLAGPVGESLFNPHGEHSEECDKDLQMATQIMERMIFQYGFYAEETGPVDFESVKSLSEETKLKLDRLRHRELKACRARVHAVLSDKYNFAVVEELARQLMSNNCFMSYDQIEEFLGARYDLDAFDVLNLIIRR